MILNYTCPDIPMTYLLYSHLLSVFMLSVDVRKRFTIKDKTEIIIFGAQAQREKINSPLFPCL